MQVRYDPDADALYVSLRPGTIARTEPADDYSRAVDYDADGNVIGVEFLTVSKGISVAGLPDAADVRRALESMHSLAVS